MPRRAPSVADILERQVRTRACRTNQDCLLSRPIRPVALPGHLSVSAFMPFDAQTVAVAFGLAVRSKPAQPLYRRCLSRLSEPIADSTIDDQRLTSLCLVEWCQIRAPVGPAIWAHFGSVKTPANLRRLLNQ